MKKALIAMSGGVDSSVAAYLIKKKGFECIGATMRLHCKENEDASCLTSKDIEDARKIASSLDMPYEVYDFQDNFREKVIDKFVKTYKTGGTPNPCIDCNRHLKFAALMNKMAELSCDYVVTGHYARVAFDEKSGRYLLKKGLDESKDQSYVLYSLTQEQLSHILLPLGEYTKEETRQIAEKLDLELSQKKDSQDICFVPDGDYAKFIEEYTGEKFSEGDFVDLNGNKLGTHKGIIRYTIGQRKGLGLALPASMYVTKTSVEENKVYLGFNEDLFSKELEATDINLIFADEIKEPIKCTAKIRYKHKEAPCTVWQTEKDRIHIEFDEPQRAITKGQAVVLYDGDTVLGGGTIEKCL